MNKLQKVFKGAEFYTVGFILSLVCTILAYFSVQNHFFEGTGLTTVIVLLAVSQLFVQLVYFLHIGSKKGSKTNTLLVMLTGFVVVVLVFGSIWIMNNLNYNMMSPKDTNEYIIKDELITK